jgi:cation transport regulator ChaC
MVSDVLGKDGSCTDYVREIASVLSALGIEDPVVSELWAAVKKT